MKISILSVQDHYPEHGQRTVAELYEQVLTQAECAEQYGYDGFFVAEHHFHEYGAVPNPAVMLASMAQRTRRIRLGSAISILTFHNPLTVAETYGMLDNLCGGRLVFGVGSGYLKHEYEGYNIDAQTKRDRFDENLALVERLVRGERVSFEGKYNSINAVRINSPAVQKDLPLHVAVLRREAAYHVGRQGRPIMCVPYASLDSVDQVGELMADYHRGREEVGLRDHAGKAMIAMHTHVAETDEAARAIAAPPFDLYVATRLYAKRAVYDDIIRSGLSLFGSVDTVVDKMVRLYEAGVDHVMALQNFGLMPPEQVDRSMRLLAEEVMPRVQARIGVAQAA